MYVKIIVDFNNKYIYKKGAIKLFKFDHFVVNVNSKYQKDKNIINTITSSDFPYEPS